MKIGTVTSLDNVRQMSQVREKSDGEKGGQNSGNNPYHQKKEQEPEKFEVTEEKLADAVQSFRSDPSAQGLQADMDGVGPGLRVVLKDGSGAIVRQFTGEEFLRLRDAARDGMGRGKILDQKL